MKPSQLLLPIFQPVTVLPKSPLLPLLEVWEILTVSLGCFLLYHCFTRISLLTPSWRCLNITAVKTWKNEHFEYHSQCDLVLVSHPAFADGLGLDVQIRTKLVRFWSYIKSAAIRIGDDIFEVQGNGGESNQLKFWYNFQFQKDTKTVGGFPVTMELGKGKYMNNRYIIDLDSKYPGQKIVLSTWKEFVRVDFVNANSDAFGESVGMLGDFTTGETLSRDGRVLEDFHEYGDDWQVRPTDNMLFHNVEKPQFPSKCIMPEDPQGERRRRLDESTISYEQAEEACGKLQDPLDRKDCVYDILATQDTTMAGAY